MVSIVLPTLNRQRFIQQSVASCLDQTYGNLELIVVDGSPSDKPVESCLLLADPRVRIIRQTNMGERLPGALNDGFALASGEYFTWAQDDDCFVPTAIETLVSALRQHPEVGLVYSGLRLIDERGEVIGEPEVLLPSALYWTNPVGHCFLYRRSVADEVGIYDPEYFMAEDIHYWMRVRQRARILSIQDRLYYHRWHEESLTIKDYGNYFAARLAAKARREVLGIGLRQFLSQISPVYIMEAFAAHANGDLSRVRRNVLLGLLSDPTWVRNRGVLSIGLESLVGGRQLHRLSRRLLRQIDQGTAVSRSG
jgi:glycosyltransferase involved in cell wall biosynthesis